MKLLNFREAKYINKFVFFQKIVPRRKARGNLWILKPSDLAGGQVQDDASAKLVTPSIESQSISNILHG